jgi:hypothetical protein
MKKLSRIVLGEVGQCIYCHDDNSSLSTEHIIPYGLNGRWELSRASCSRCAKVTSKFERSVQRVTYLLNRKSMKLPSRRKDMHLNKFELIVNRTGKNEQIWVTAEDHPATLIFLQLAEPAFLDGRPLTKGVTVVGMIEVRGIGPSLEEVAKRYNAKEVATTATFVGNDLERMLAKSAYGFAVAKFGLDGFERVFVVPTILGEKDDSGRWVGCDKNINLAAGRNLHEVAIEVMSNRVVIIRIKLFSIFATPEYKIVVGILRDEIYGKLPRMDKQT